MTPSTICVKLSVTGSEDDEFQVTYLVVVVGVTLQR